MATDKPRGPNEGVHTEEKSRKALEEAEQSYRESDDWRPLPTPPPAWVKLDDKNVHRRPRRGIGIGHNGDDAINPAEVWVEPETRWYSQYAAKILPLLPLDGILASGAKGTFLRVSLGASDLDDRKKRAALDEAGAARSNGGRFIRMDTVSRTNPRPRLGTSYA